MDSTASIPEATAPPTLVFRVGEALYGCDIREIQEIIPLRATTRLPGTPPYVRGLLNVRGTIVTVLDLGARLDSTRAPLAHGTILLVRHHERLVGLVVDEVIDVRVLVVEETRATVPDGAIARGAAPLDDTSVVLLDLDAVIKQVLLS